MIGFRDTAVSNGGRRRGAAMLLSLLCLAPLQWVAAASFPLPSEGETVIGAVRIIKTRYEDTLLDIARQNGLGFEEITRANPDVDLWLPGEGTEVVLPIQFVLPPGPRQGIVLNLPEFRLYYYPEPPPGEAPVVITYPVSIGRMDWSTPLGRTEITAKVTNPTWYPPQSIRDEHAADGRPLPQVVPAGRQNPLGRHAMSLSLPGYLIHGTNKPAGVGMRVTHGCIRMYPENIRDLFATVPLHTPVHIINEPYKVGWDGDSLVLEAHVPLEEDRADGEFDLTEMTRVLVNATDERHADVDWDLAEEISRAHRGMPEPIGGPEGTAGEQKLSGWLEGWCLEAGNGAGCGLE